MKVSRCKRERMFVIEKEASGKMKLLRAEVMQPSRFGCHALSASQVFKNVLMYVVLWIFSILFINFCDKKSIF